MCVIDNYMDIFRIFKIHCKGQISVFRNFGTRRKDLKDTILTRTYKLNEMQRLQNLLKNKEYEVRHTKRKVFFIKKK